MHRLEIDRRGRFYRLDDGTELPSVTNILGAIAKPALIYWAANQERDLVMRAACSLYRDLPLNAPKMTDAAYIDTLRRRLGTEKSHQRELRKAADIGTQAHALIEWNLRRELGQTQLDQPQIGPKAMWAFSRYEEWRRSVRLRPIFIEQPVWSRRHLYAGTIDLCAEVKESDVLSVVDWKTGKAIYEEALLQNAAYVEALIEMGHASHDTHGLIVRLPKVEGDPEFETRVITPQERHRLFQVFLQVRALWEFIDSAKRGKDFAEEEVRT